MRAKRRVTRSPLLCDTGPMIPVIASFSKGNSHNSGSLKLDIPRVRFVLLRIKRGFFGRFGDVLESCSCSFRALPLLFRPRTGEIEADLRLNEVVPRSFSLHSFTLPKSCEFPRLLSQRSYQVTRPPGDPNFLIDNVLQRIQERALRGSAGISLTKRRNSRIHHFRNVKGRLVSKKLGNRYSHFASR